MDFIGSFGPILFIVVGIVEGKSFSLAIKMGNVCDVDGVSACLRL